LPAKIFDQQSTWPKEPWAFASGENSDMKKPLKHERRRIRQNAQGSWNGYVGRRKVSEFGTDRGAAKAWLAGMPPVCAM